MIQDWLTRQDAAKTVGVSTRTLDRWIKQGRVKIQRLHRSILIHSKECANLRKLVK